MGDICLFCCVFYRIDYDRSLSNVYTGDICFGMVCCPFHLVIRCTKCSTLVMVVDSHAFSLIACAVGVTSKNPLPSSEKSSTDFFPRFMFHLWNRDHWAHFCQWCVTQGSTSLFWVSALIFLGTVCQRLSIPLDDLGVLLQIMRPCMWGFLYFLNIWSFWCIHCITNTQPIPLSLCQCYSILRLYIHNRFWWQSLWEVHLCSTGIPQESEHAHFWENQCWQNLSRDQAGSICQFG